MSDTARLSGVRVFLVEDEPLVAMLLAEMMEEFGCIIVGTASRLEEARAGLAGGNFDIAVLDIHLGADPVFPLADGLAAAGQSFVFASGQGAAGIPADFVGVPVVEKPCSQADLGRALLAAVRSPELPPTA